MAPRLTTTNRISKRPAMGQFPGFPTVDRRQVLNTIAKKPAAGQAGPKLPPIGPAIGNAVPAPKPQTAPNIPAPQAAQPWDTAYEQGQDAINRRLSDTAAQYESGVAQTRSDYGYDAAGSVDPNNPFSRAALLQQHIDQARKGTGTSYAAQGQLYSGALQNAQNQNATNALQSQDALGKDYQAALNTLLQNRRGVEDQAAGDLADLAGQRYDRAVAAAPGVPSAPPPHTVGHSATYDALKAAGLLPPPKPPAKKKVVGIDLGAIAGQKKGPKVIYK